MIAHIDVNTHDDNFAEHFYLRQARQPGQSLTAQSPDTTTYLYVGISYK